VNHQRVVRAAILVFALAASACDSDKTPQDGDSGSAGTGDLEQCGDGVKQGAEECDTANETWECDAACHRKRLYTACKTQADCGDGQACADGACTEVCEQQATGRFACPEEGLPEEAVGVVCYLDVSGDSGHCRARCDSDRDCPQDLRCNDNVCMDRQADAVDR
jgi:hypothetical protein